MSESTVTITNPNCKISVAGTPAAVGLNGDYFPINPDAVRGDRVWRGPTTQRVHWDNDQGWVIADLYANVETEEFDFKNSTVYFYSGAGVEYSNITAETNPWEITRWYTNFKSLIDYADVVTVTHSDDSEVIKKVETVNDYRYELTKDTTFVYATTYYTTSGIASHPYVPVAQYIVGDSIPANMFFVQLEDESYAYTADETFQETKTYYTRAYIGSGDEAYTYVTAVVAGSEIPADSYYEATGEIVRTITTITNNRTHTVNVSTEETLTITKSATRFHTRYNIPGLQSGKVYRFTFVDDFADLGFVPTTDPNDSDITKGVYRLESTLTYQDIVLSGIDIYQNIYVPLGLSKEVYELDKAQWSNPDVWYKLVNPMQKGIVYYVPLSIVKGIPDANVTEFTRYQLVTDIGIFNDPELLTELVECVNMLFRAHFGIPTAASLAAYDSIWLPNEYYDWLDEQRKQNISDFMAKNAVKYYNTLFYNEYNELAKVNAKQKATIGIYEELIPGLSKKQE